jgi:polysaccharide export outer membrane protein
MLSVEDTNAAFRESESAAESALRDLLVRRLESTEESSGYRIGVGDKLDMSVFDVPELSSSTIVNDAGFVELPVVGAVQVIGKTLSEAREAIRKALSGPVKRPDINLVISEFGSQRVAVLGAVSKPGAYPLRRHVSSFSELLGEAGGLSERAGNFVQLLPSEMTGVSPRSKR